MASSEHDPLKEVLSPEAYAEFDMATEAWRGAPTPRIVASFPMQDAQREKQERRRAALLASLKQEVRAVDSSG